ncbi:hypothetical protein H257_10562 [Aphanomyces astaci]|uniref:F-box domain-containing protein n=1 Tax=Aphanomyces astaci TaxID=112090 RepID=W4G5J1_APHAT|nr:hypothetical protein H257_10562 [Aphanomyces astaci]ETV74950.1 hypothetical protein H257_10562 [Aphanomyces astaci]|eukprot:XP_009835454.1 hypothetical protein H257_10562 [Aphanomyces astaci]
MESRRHRRQVVRPLTMLSEELEKMVLSYVPPLPNYVTWQLVCRRWRAMLLSLPAFDVNFDLVRPVDNGTRYLTLLQRWPMLRSVTMTRDIFVSNELTWQLGLSQLAHLQHVSLRHTHTKVLQELFKACHSLRTVSVLGCSDARLPTVKTSLPFLQKLELQAASLANNSSIVSILRNAPQLTHLVVSAANDVTSQVLAQLAASCPLIHQVVLNQCGLMVASQVDTFVRTFHAQLTWLDLSHSRDLKTFCINDEHSLVFDKLQVLVVDNTLIRDSVLQTARCPHLDVLSIQNCRCITDAGVVSFAVANAGAPLTVFEAKNTAITDVSINALAQSMPLLTHVGVESCRGVSRAVRQRCALQCHTHAMSYERVLVATNASAYRKDNVGVDFAAKPIKKTSAGLLPYGLDEDYNPRDHHQEFEEDDTDASQRRGRNAPGSRPATPRRNTRR